MTQVSIDTFKEKFEREVVRLMRDGKVPGMSILITKDINPFMKEPLGPVSGRGGNQQLLIHYMVLPP